MSTDQLRSPGHVIQLWMRRPAFWGVFICLAAVLASFLFQQLLLGPLNDDPSAVSRNFEGSTAVGLQHRLDLEVGRLLAVAGAVRADSMVLREIVAQTPMSVAPVFDRLRRHRPDEETTIEILDSRGSVMAWSGKSRGKAGAPPAAENDTVVFITRTSLDVILSAGVKDTLTGSLIVANRILRSMLPSTFDWYANRSLTDHWESELGIRLASNGSSGSGSFRVTLTDPTGSPLLDVTVQSIPAEELRNRETSVPDLVRTVSLVIGALLISISALRSTHRSPLLSSVLIVTALWSNRLLWRALDFPNVIAPGPLFDPQLYASASWIGLTGSLGDLILTLAVLAGSCWVLAWFIRGRNGMMAPRWQNRFPWISPLQGVAVVLMFAWSARGYAEGCRSIVFDSVVQFNELTRVLPDMVSVAGHAAVALLTLGFLGLAISVTWILRSLWRSSAAMPVQRWLLALSVVLTGCLFVAIDAPSPLSGAYLGYAVFVAMGLSFLLDRLASKQAVRKLVLGTGSVLLFTVALAIPLLESKIHEKERTGLEAFADDLVRPSDSWYAYLLREAFRAVGSTRPALEDSLSSDPGEVAFSVWLRLGLNRPGFRSLLVLYTAEGKEVSRFSRSFTSYEQQEHLSRLFASEEESFQLLERDVSGKHSTAFGMWGVLRDSANTVQGSLALVLGVQKSPGRVEAATDPLRSGEQGPFDTGFRRVAVSEFVDGSCVSSGLSDGLDIETLPPTAAASLASSPSNPVWYERTIGEASYATLYRSDPADPRRAIAVHVQPLDVRWRLFNLAKVIFLYLIVWALVVIPAGWALGRRSDVIHVGFRARLFAAFAFLAIAPVAGIGIYNTRVAEERMRESVSSLVTRDLDLVAGRIGAYVSSMEDFDRGVTNDFCEAVASDLKIDFSVYAGSTLKASSAEELFTSSFLDRRLEGRAFGAIMLRHRPIALLNEQLGSLAYLVGYRPLIIGGRIVGVLSIPTIFRQREIEEDLAQRNGFAVAASLVVFLMVLAIAALFTRRLAGPIKELTDAAHVIGQGNLDVTLTPKSNDEIGSLVRSFNEMVKELKQSRENLSRAERESAWKEMAKQVAHEIKNPLTPIKLSLQHLRQAFRDRAEKREELVDQVTAAVIGQVDTLSRIATEFSSFARMPSGRYEQVDVHLLIQDTVRLFSQVGQIEFQLKLADTDMRIVADREELQRAFINIFRNGIQAMNSAGVLLVETSVADRMATVRVTDTGTGIPEELRSKVFEPNFSTKTEGMGLGLAITRKAVENVNGTVTFETALGKGTTFVVRFPV